MNVEKNLPCLFEAGKIGRLELKNRIIMPAMATNLSDTTGSVTQGMIDYYRERARGGVGLIIVESTTVEFPQGKASPFTLSIHDDSLIPAHNRLVETVHRQGAKVALQIFHAGIRASPAITGRQPVGPSCIPCRILDVLPRELTIREISELIEKFVRAARRAQKSGYDAIELHGAHGHLISQFMSAYFNIRRDSYGGNLENRLRFAREIIEGIEWELGDEYPLIFRLSGDEFVEGGRRLSESIQVSSIIENYGVSAIHLTAGIRETYDRAIEPMPYEQGWKIYMAESVKKCVKVPIIAVGVIREPKFAENVLEKGKADFVAIGRGLIADPHWPIKAANGQEREICRCISCNSCFKRLEEGLSLRCAINPEAGCERIGRSVRVAKRRKKVMVVGGGPAGMISALIAKKRGHQVSLYEKGCRLGGQLILGSIPPGKEKIKWFLEYLTHQIERENVQPTFDTSVTVDILSKEKPDAVVLATGACPLVPDIPGKNNKPVYTAWQCLQGGQWIEDKHIVIIGGGSVGCETALYLSKNNKNISVVEMQGSLCMDIDSITRYDLISRIKDSKIEIVVNSQIVKITPNGVFLSNGNGTRKNIVADVVVLACGSIAQDSLKKDIQNLFREVYIIGDCYKPRGIMGAIRDGFQTGRII